MQSGRQRIRPILQGYRPAFDTFSHETGDGDLHLWLFGRHYADIGLRCLLHRTVDRQLSVAHWWFETRFPGTAL